MAIVALVMAVGLVLVMHGFVAAALVFGAFISGFEAGAKHARRKARESNESRPPS